MSLAQRRSWCRRSQVIGHGSWGVGGGGPKGLTSACCAPGPSPPEAEAEWPGGGYCSHPALEPAVGGPGWAWDGAGPSGNCKSTAAALDGVQLRAHWPLLRGTNITGYLVTCHRAAEEEAWLLATGACCVRSVHSLLRTRVCFHNIRSLSLVALPGLPLWGTVWPQL